MNITQIRAQNYKSIIDTGWVPIEDDLTTLLGRNESGKTSFLEAIRYFGEEREIEERELHDGKEYSENHSVPIVRLRGTLSSEDVKYICQDEIELEAESELISTKYSDGTHKIKTVQGKHVGHLIDPLDFTQEKIERFWQDFNDLRNRYNGKFRNHFDNNLKQTANRIRNDEVPDLETVTNRVNKLLNNLENLPQQNDEIRKVKEEWTDELEDIQDKLANINGDVGVAQLFPPVVYHGGFDTISDEAPANSLESEDYRTFKNLLRVVDLDYENFDRLGYYEQSRELESAEATIRGQVNELWQQKEVDVDISYRDNRFIVGIKDTAIRHPQSNGGNENRSVTRTIKRPSDRSKGFQWFFSFYINLRAETDGQPSQNRLILLDDPAVFLHPEGKKNWIRAIERMSESVQIIYSSHSPFLIKKEYPNRIRIVEDREEEATVVTEDFHDSDSMALEPLRNALGIGLGDSPFVSKRKILVEGVSDYDIITGVANYFRERLDEDYLRWGEVTVMPTNGADNMIQAAKWVSSEEFSYVLLLDNDQKGKDVSDEIAEQHHEIEPTRIVHLEKDDGGRNFNIEIEDMFAPEFYIDCVNSTYDEQFDDFEHIISEENDDGIWLIDDQEYKGRKIVNRVENALDDRDRGDLDKILVADEIQSRLTAGRDVSDDDVIGFRKVLGQISNKI